MSHVEKEERDAMRENDAFLGEVLPGEGDEVEAEATAEGLLDKNQVAEIENAEDSKLTDSETTQTQTSIDKHNKIVKDSSIQNSPSITEIDNMDCIDDGVESALENATENVGNRETKLTKTTIG